MREIKFRAWHKQDGYMILPEHCESFDINFTPKGYDGFSFDIRYKGSGGVLGSHKHIELMQYTGLKDRNGKEIYEGDICKKTYGSSTPVFTVAYHDARGMFIMQDGYNEPLYTVNNSMVEIIGNIYENPELLK